MIKEFPAEIDSIPQITEFIGEQCKIYHLHDKEIRHAQLMSEESINKFLEYKDSDTSLIRVKINKFLGSIYINIYAQGKKIKFSEILNGRIDLLNQENMSTETAEAISNLIMKSFANRLSYYHNDNENINRIKITALKSPYTMLYKTLFALLCAIITGLLMKNFASESLCMNLNDNFLSPVREIFLDGLKMCAVGVVFFSLTSCIMNLGNLSELKRVGTVLLICFVIMQITAALIGIGVTFLFTPGSSIKLSADLPVSSSPEITISLKDTIVNLIPSNIIKPFLEADMLQLTILAIFVGYAVSVTAANNLKYIIDECYRVFMQIIQVFMKIIPLVIFCSITSIILTSGGDVMLSLLGIIASLHTMHIIFIIIFLLVSAIIGRLNPFRIIVKSMQLIITAVITCSSTSAIPDNMNAVKNMGVDSKIYSLSIPLGTSINKVTFTIGLIAAPLIGAQMFGINISIEKALYMIFPVIMLMLATPPIPGGILVSYTAAFTLIGVPVDALGIFVAIDPIVEMLATATACLGNTFATLITAGHEKMIDHEIFNS
ncbi:MAG: dicarboxylate/amino acid:cation symporter [Synergistaceae bacterium]|nr:dicarboxylate/amino acid:cation symporter [Synergistaceae bacterium]